MLVLGSFSQLGQDHLKPLTVAMQFPNPKALLPLSYARAT